VVRTHTGFPADVVKQMLGHGKRSTQAHYIPVIDQVAADWKKMVEPRMLFMQAPPETVELLDVEKARLEVEKLRLEEGRQAYQAMEQLRQMFADPKKENEELRKQLLAAKHLEEKKNHFPLAHYHPPLTPILNSHYNIIQCQTRQTIRPFAFSIDQPGFPGKILWKRVLTKRALRSRHRFRIGWSSSYSWV